MLLRTLSHLLFGKLMWFWSEQGRWCQSIDAARDIERGRTWVWSRLPYTPAVVPTRESAPVLSVESWKGRQVRCQP